MNQTSQKQYEPWHYDLEDVSHIIVPRLKWSDRSSEKYEQRRRIFKQPNNAAGKDKSKQDSKRSKYSQQEVICGLQKLVILGNCIDTNDQSFHMYAMLYNVQEMRADRFQILPNIHNSDQISAINFGPYDNGYLFIGLNTGYLLAFDIAHGSKSKPKNQSRSEFQLPGISQILEIQLSSSPIT